MLESYMREVVGVKLIDDTAYERILNQKDTTKNISVDPPNFCILQNQLYQAKIGFTPYHMCETESKK